MNIKRKLATLLRKWARQLDPAMYIPPTTPLPLETRVCEPMTIKCCYQTKRWPSHDFMESTKRHMRDAIASQLTTLYDKCIVITETPLDGDDILLTAELRVLKPKEVNEHL